MVRDECGEEFMYYLADNQVYEHRINNHDQLQVFGAANRPRRNPTKNPLLQPPAVQKKEKQLKKTAERSGRKGKRVLKQAGEVEIGNNSEETDDLLYTPEKTEPSGYNNPAKLVGGDHPVERGTQTYQGDVPRLIKSSKVNYDQYARHFPGDSLEGIK